MLNLNKRQTEKLSAVDAQDIEKDLAWLSKEHHHLISCLDPRYPALLKQISDAPAVLFGLGDAHLLQYPQLAIVGSRNPSVTGKEMAQEFAKHLAQAGLTITSGLAQGIDGMAHEGALAVKGHTIAVCGTGLDKVYPERHRDLAQRIAQQGLLISEYPLGFPPKTEHFPMRNRLISGLSLGVLVVEAALQSGSLITARTATEQGREVFAIPGSIHNPLARGCHRLIRQGAKLVETAQDIIEELGPLARVQLNLTGKPVLKTSPPPLEKSVSPPTLDEDYHAVLRNIGGETTSIDVLVARTGFRAEAVASMLLMLELEGFVKNVTGGYIRTL